MTDKNMFSKNYFFYGRHAEMVNSLVNKIDEGSGAKLFNSTIELLIFSAAMGLFCNRRSKADSDKSVHASVLAEQFDNKSRELQIVFKFVVLLGGRDDNDDVSRLNMAFRNPEADGNYRMFEEYVLGGLEETHERLMVESNRSYQDYLTSLNSMLGSFGCSDADDADDADADDFVEIINEDFFE